MGHSFNLFHLNPFYFHFFCIPSLNIMNQINTKKDDPKKQSNSSNIKTIKKSKGKQISEKVNNTKNNILNTDTEEFVEINNASIDDVVKSL